MIRSDFHNLNDMVGREPEFTMIWQRLSIARAGQTTVVILAGDPGIGKSRLLMTLADQASKVGALTLRGGAVEAEGMPPYLPFLEALGRYIRTTDRATLETQCGRGAAILATILPELLPRLGELPSTTPLPIEQARLRLYEAVTDFLAAIAATQPLVLILDDLHWADPASLDLIRHIVRTQPDLPLLIAGAYRPAEGADNPTLAWTWTELRRLRALTNLVIAPLTAPALATLAATHLGGAIEPTLASLLHSHSEGNPFFAEELLHTWAEEGMIREFGGRWQLAGMPGQRPPATILETVQQRVARLPADTTDLLRTASVIGREFDVELLARASGHEAEATEDRLRPAIRAQLVRADEMGGYRFSHDQVRESLYAEVSPLRRRRLHSFIGAALEANATLDSAQRVADLAFHFVRSGDRTRGARYSRLAATRALELYALDDAIRHYQATLDLLDPNDNERGALLLELGLAALPENAQEVAERTFLAAHDWFQRDEDRLATARAAHGLGQLRWRQERLAEALASFEEARDLLDGEACPVTVQVLTDLGSLLAVSLARHEAGLDYGQRALAIARALGDHRLEATAGRTVGNLLIRGNDFATGLPLLERSLALAEAAGDPAEAAECCGCLAVAYDWVGDIERAIAVTLQRKDFAERSHDRFQLRHLDGWLAAMYCYRCRWAEAERLIAESRAFIERLGSPEPLASWHIVRGLSAWMRGDYRAAEGPLDTGIALLREIGPNAAIWYLGSQAVTKLGVGKRAAALVLLAELDQLVAEQPPTSMATAEVLTYLAHLAIALGDRTRADDYAARLAPFRDQHHAFLVDRLLGECAILRCAWAEATSYLDAAEANARRYDNLQELAHLAMSRAALARAQGGAGAQRRPARSWARRWRTTSGSA